MSLEDKLLPAETEFSLGLLRKSIELVLDSSSSLILSPLSIALAYAMVHSGANGEAKDEIKDVILKGSTHEEFTEYFSDIGSSIEKLKKGVEVKIANRLFVPEGSDIKHSYLDHIEKNYKATAQNLDFEMAEKAAKEVNNFVSKATREKIKDLVTPASFVGGGAVLINALYLDAKWMDVFDSGYTRPGCFHTKHGEKKYIDIMNDSRRECARYTEDAKVEVALLGFKDLKMKFAVFLPKERFGLTDFVKDLTGEKFQNYLKKARGQTLNMKLPKMKLETSVKLPKILESLGMSTVFDSADLSGITPGLVISDSNHKAVIEVNEKGTVAAAATSVEMDRDRVRIVDFFADHPFLFAVVYKNHPVFVGMFRG